MNWISVQRIVTGVFIRNGYASDAKKQFKLRPILDIVTKYEELKYKKLEAERTDNQAKVKYYDDCLGVLDWVLNGNKKDK